MVHCVHYAWRWLELSDGMDELLRGYRGHRDFTKHVKDMMRCLLAMPRHALTQHNLSERTWSVLHRPVTTYLIMYKSLAHTHII